MKKHKIIASLLSAAMLFSGFIADIADAPFTLFSPIRALAADTALTYAENEDGTLTITGCTDKNALTELVIPADIGGKAVTAIGEKAFENTKITSAVLPEGLTAIGKNSFALCHDLESINFPSTLKTIGDGAFQYNSNLTVPTLNDGLETIGSGAFKYTLMDSVTIPASVKSCYQAFSSCRITSATVKAGAVLEKYMFSDCGKLESVVIEDGPEVLPHGIFYNCPSLTSVTLPSTLKTAQQNAFCGCTALKEVTFPDGFKTLESAVFQKCSALEAVTIPASVTLISESAFMGCTAIKEFIIDSKNEKYSCENSAIVENTEYSKNLIAAPYIDGEFVVPDGVTKISSNAFYKHENLTSVKMSDSVTELGTCAFQSCLSLTSVQLSNNLTYIGGYCFNNCTSLEQITIPEKVQSLGGNVFANTAIKKIHIPKSVSNISSDSFANMPELEEITVDAENTIYYDIDSVLYSNESYYTPSSLVKYPPKKTDTDYTVASAVSNISSNAFENVVFLKNVTLHDNVTTIDSNAFTKAASLESIYIPNSVKSIGSGAFSDSGIKNIVLPKGLTTIKSYTFYNCESLESVTVPAGVKNIEYSVFPNSGSFKLLGYDGTYIEEYAANNSIEFESLGSIPIENIFVETPEEFLASLMSYSEITLADGIYTFNKSNQYDTSPIIIQDLKNVTIKAEHPGCAEILSNDGYTPVIQINNSSDIEIDGLILGHKTVSYHSGGGCGDYDTGEEYSSGYVVYAYKSENISVKNSDLYGCGTVAAVLYETNNFCADSCVLRDCKENIADIKLCSGNISFKDCVISGCAYDKSYAESKHAVNTSSNAEDCTILFDGCIFLNNFSKSFALDTEPKTVKTENCIFSDNKWDDEEPKTYGICLNGITWEMVETQNGSVLNIGKSIKLSDGTSIESAQGSVLPYSVYSVPWKGMKFTDVSCAAGVSFDSSDIIDPEHMPAKIIAESSITGTAYIPKTKELELSVEIKGSGRGSAVVYVAVYDENGCLLGVDTYERVISKKTPITETYVVKFDNAEKTTDVKLFVFDEKDGVSPLANMVKSKIK